MGDGVLGLGLLPKRLSDILLRGGQDESSVLTELAREAGMPVVSIGYDGRFWSESFANALGGGSGSSGYRTRKQALSHALNWDTGMFGKRYILVDSRWDPVAEEWRVQKVHGERTR